jgi:hypothetical protein
MANMAARRIARTPTPEQYQFFGGFASTLPESSKQKDKGNLFTGPNWFTDNMDNLY